MVPKNVLKALCTQLPGTKLHCLLLTQLKEEPIVRKVDELGALAILAPLPEYYTHVGLVLSACPLLLVFYAVESDTYIWWFRRREQEGNV